MIEFLIFTADHEYFCIAYGEADRDNMLRQCMIQNHAEGYAKPLPASNPEHVRASIDAFQAAYERGLRAQAEFDAQPAAMAAE